MRTRIFSRLVFALLCCTHLVQAADTGPQLPAYRKVVLTNGLTLLLMEQHKVPLVSYHILVRAGSTADPAGKEGLAMLAAELLERGTEKHTATQIATNLDYTGGTLGIGADDEHASLAGNFLKKDSNTMLDLLAELLQHPAYPKTEVKKLVEQEVDDIKGAKEAARSVLPRYFAGALYGPHPYGRPAGGDEHSLTAIQRKDLVEFYARHYGPETSILALVGDFDSGQMERLVQEKFGNWKATKRSGSQNPGVAEPAKGRKLLLVDKPDSTQTYFAIGNTGIARNNPDRTAIQVVNLLFGGRFTSMLNDALRVNSGLTYGASSAFTARQSPGPFAITSFTRNATTVQALDMALEVLEQLHRDGVTEEQLNSAKNYIKGQFPPNIETPDQLAGKLAELEFYGLDKAEINELFPRIDAVTTAEARRIIDHYFPRENLVFVLIGKAAEIEASVKKYAPQMEKRSIDQPGF